MQKHLFFLLIKHIHCFKLPKFPSMEFLHFLSFLSMAMIVSHAAAAVAPETYWQLILPNTPMPKSLTQLLNNEDKSMDDIMILGRGSVWVQELGTTLTGGNFINFLATDDRLKDDPNLTLFFLENDLQRGKPMNLHFTKTTTPFLPRTVADALPFSSQKLPEIYARFAIKPDTVASETIKRSLRGCEYKGMEGEETYCATSLEAMIDFATSKLGNEVRTVSTEVDARETTTPLQKYSVHGVEKLATHGAVGCHKLNYPYAVFYCHTTAPATVVYAVSLVGEDGTEAKAVAICHTDTSKWSPKHLAFRMLKVKPGSASLCHFLPEDHVIWVPNYDIYPRGFSLAGI